MVTVHPRIDPQQGLGSPDAPTLSAFIAQFPELADRDAALIGRMIEVAHQIHAFKPLATLYLAAHLLVIEAETTGAVDGGSGEVSRETSVGGKAADYKAMAESGREVFYTRTSYGRIFLTLEKRTGRRGLSVMAL